MFPYKVLCLWDKGCLQYLYLLEYLFSINQYLIMPWAVEAGSRKNAEQMHDSIVPQEETWKQTQGTLMFQFATWFSLFS